MDKEISIEEAKEHCIKEAKEKVIELIKIFKSLRDDLINFDKIDDDQLKFMCAYISYAYDELKNSTAKKAIERIEIITKSAEDYLSKKSNH